MNVVQRDVIQMPVYEPGYVNINLGPSWTLPGLYMTINGRCI